MTKPDLHSPPGLLISLHYKTFLQNDVLFEAFRRKKISRELLMRIAVKWWAVTAMLATLAVLLIFLQSNRGAASGLKWN